MTQQADPLALSPFMFGEAFFAGAVAMQRQIAEGMLAVFDAAADAMRDSLRATAAFAHDIGNAQTPAEAAAAGFAWLQGRAERATTRFSALPRVAPATSGRPHASESLAPLATAMRRAPVVPQAETRMQPKPPAGKLHGAVPTVLPKTPKKPARTGAK